MRDEITVSELNVGDIVIKKGEKFMITDRADRSGLSEDQTSLVAITGYFKGSLDYLDDDTVVAIVNATTVRIMPVA